MTYDPTKPYKNVDGININLSAQELAQQVIDQAAYAAQIAAYIPPVNPIVQLSQLLVTKGILQAVDVQTALANTAIASQVQATLNKGG